jgi:hypothetical protein
MSINLENRNSLDQETAALLPLFRYHLAALQGTDPLAWRIAFCVAAQRWGEGLGLALAYRVQVLLSAILVEREKPFQIADPLDLSQREAITADERILITMLDAMRGGDTARARALIASLTDGRAAAAVVEAGLSLALLLNTPFGSIRRPVAPKLRIVC